MMFSIMHNIIGILSKVQIDIGFKGGAWNYENDISAEKKTES